MQQQHVTQPLALRNVPGGRSYCINAAVFVTQREKTDANFNSGAVFSEPDSVESPALAVKCIFHTPSIITFRRRWYYRKLQSSDFLQFPAVKAFECRIDVKCLSLSVCDRHRIHAVLHVGVHHLHRCPEFLIEHAPGMETRNFVANAGKHFQELMITFGLERPVEYHYSRHALSDHNGKSQCRLQQVVDRIPSAQRV